MKFVVFFSVLLSACSPSVKQKADRDAAQLKEDLKRGFDKAKNSPATKELEGDVKKGFRQADEAVTKELNKGREKVRQGTQDSKRKADENSGR